MTSQMWMILITVVYVCYAFPPVFTTPVPASDPAPESLRHRYLLPTIRNHNRVACSCPFSLLNQEHQNIIYIGPYGTRSNQPIYLFQSMIGAVIS